MRKARDIKKPTIQSLYLRTLAEKGQLKVLKLIQRISVAFVNDVIDITDRRLMFRFRLDYTRNRFADIAIFFIKLIVILFQSKLILTFPIFFEIM